MERKWGTLLGCCFSCFTAWLDYSIVNIALPSIEISLKATVANLQWVINAYMLAMIVFIVTLGRLADWIGRKKVNVIAIGAFGLFSLFCGLSPSANWLIAWRFFQGITAAALVPSSLALISHAFPGPEKGKAIGIWSTITGLAVAAGPVIGGFLISSFGWPWIFFINVPIALVSLFICIYFATESHGAGDGAQRIDFKGFALFTIGLMSFIFSLMHAPDWGWLSYKSLICYLMACLFLGWFYRSEKRSVSPIIPFAIFNNCSFFCSTMLMFTMVFALSSDLFLIPLYLLQVRDTTPSLAGFYVLALTAPIVLISPLTGHLMNRFSTKRLMIVGLVIYCLSTIFQAFITAESSTLFLLISYALLGIGWAIARPPATTTAIASTSHHFAATATGVLWSVQNIGGAISIALTITIFRKIFETTSNTESFMAGYQTAMWMLSALSLVCLVTLVIYMRSKQKSF